MTAMIIAMESVRAGRELLAKLTDIESIADRVRLARKAGGYNTNGLSAASGVAANTISNYETGLRRPSIDQVALLLPHLNVTLDWIYFGDERGLTVEVQRRLRQTAATLPPRPNRRASNVG